MAKFRTDDIIFGRSLMDPLYRANFAIGTTYSLDLDTFISLPFSLGFLEEPDAVMRSSIPYIFSALRICSKNLAVFCNYSEIKVPPETRKVYYALMEGSVFPINADRKSGIVNFHPKVWVISQTGLHGEGTKIRVIVMSRNLSKSNDLDCACVLDGKVGKREASASAQAKHQPLVDFLRYLSRRADDTKRNQIKKVIDDILKIEKFDIEGSLYDDYDFLPMGIKDHSGLDTLEEIVRAPHSVVVSPFIDDRVIGRFAKTRSKLLVTNDESVTQTVENAFAKESIYTMNPRMRDNDIDECVRLHAKMYFTYSSPKGENRWFNHLYLGSTNATTNGFGRNVEFMMRFRFTPGRMSWREFSSYFKEDPEQRFLPMAGIMSYPDSDREEYERSKALRGAVASIQSAAVTPDEDGTYSVRMSISQGLPNAFIYPMMRPDLRTSPIPDLVFQGMALTDISEFFVIEAEGLKRVIKVIVVDMPDKRDDAICRAALICNSKSLFSDCISFLLSDSKTAYILEKEAYNKALSGGAVTQNDDAVFAAVYENLLKRAYESPATFNDIREFVEGLPSDVVPEAFSSVFNAVSGAIKSFRR